MLLLIKLTKSAIIFFFRKVRIRRPRSTSHFLYYPSPPGDPAPHAPYAVRTRGRGWMDHDSRLLESSPDLRAPSEENIWPGHFGWFLQESEGSLWPGAARLRTATFIYYYLPLLAPRRVSGSARRSTCHKARGKIILSFSLSSPLALSLIRPPRTAQSRARSSIAFSGGSPDLWLRYFCGFQDFLERTKNRRLLMFFLQHSTNFAFTKNARTHTVTI
jgi:hypothetical protein